MADNLFDQGQQKTPTPVENTSTPSSGNLFDQGQTGGGSASAPQETQVASAAPTSGNLFDAGQNRPVNGPPAEASHIYQDESQPWYKRAWDYANTPLTESLFGLPEYREGAGGFERGIEKIASGFTSPLSVALTAATFGTGGLIESAGANALKATGEFAAGEIPQIMKASQVAVNAMKDLKAIEPAINSALEKEGGTGLLNLVNRAKEATGPLDLSGKFGEDSLQNLLEKKGFTEAERTQLANASSTIEKAKAGFTPIEDAVRDSGIDPSLWKRGQEALYNNGLTEHDLLGGNALERGAYQILRKTIPGMSVAAAARVGKSANALLSAGFTLQQFETAAAMSPRFLDALKEGDYDKAWEYGTEAAAGAAFGVLGTSHALHSAGELFKPLLETDKFRPNDQWLALDRAAKERDVQHVVAEQHATELDKQIRTALGHEGKQTPQQKIELAQAFNATIKDPGSPEARAWYNALATAANHPDFPPLPQAGGGATPIGGPVNGQPPVGQPIAPSDIPSRANTSVIKENQYGEVRVGADGRPVVYLSPEAWGKISEKEPELSTVAGLSQSPQQAAQLKAKLEDVPLVRDLFETAQQQHANQVLTAAPTAGTVGDMTRVVAEELQHTWQRELSQNGVINKHLNFTQWERLSGILPKEQVADLDANGYSANPIARVAETAAKYRAGIIPDTVSDEDAARWLHAYYKEVEAKHGPQMLDEANKINEVARQHVQELYEKRQASAANAGADQRVGRGVQEGAGRSPSVGEAEPPLQVRKLGDEEPRFVDVVHGSRTPGLESISSEFHGKGPQAGAERTRAKNFPDDFVKRSYFRVQGSHGEPFYEHQPYQYQARLNEEGLYNWEEDPDKLLPKAQAEAASRKIQNQPGAIGTIYERMMKDAGYDGYYHPGSQEVAAFKDTPVEAKMLKEEPILASRDRRPNPDVDRLAAEYNSTHGISKIGHVGLAPLDTVLSKQVADAYDAMKHNPDSPETKKAYEALIRETRDQWNAAQKAGYKFEPWTKDGQPYTNSEEMSADVRNNKHLYYFPGGDIPSDHPLAGVDPKTGESYNNMFRAVHDLFGHAKGDYEFGPRGEENAFLAHSRMYSKEAIPALLSETKGQNSWVNFGKHLRDENGNIPAKGEKGYVSPTERPFAEQKAGVLSDDLIQKSVNADRRSGGRDLPALQTKLGQLDKDLSDAQAKLDQHSPKDVERNTEAYQWDLRTVKNIEDQKSAVSAGIKRLASQEPSLYNRDREESPVWYLKANKVIDQKISGPQPADQVMRTLEAAGVKPDELKYTGLQYFLKSKGTEPVRPDELREYLRANNLQIQEVTKGGPNSGWTPEDQEELEGIYDTEQEYTLNPRTEALKEQLEEKRRKAVEPVKFGSYQLPGGQNYRELLLTLPEVGEVRHVRPPGSLGRTVTQRVGQFQSSHWDEPNVLGHVRFNDRTGPKGEKLLHLEELQSDWHQKGRTEGYKSETASGPLVATRQAGYWEIHTPDGKFVTNVQDWQHPDVKTSEDAVAEARRRAVAEPQRTRGGVPDAPFKKTWPELLMKRMIRYASENGYDGISWTPGEEQAARYDLSKQVKDVNVLKRDDGTYDLQATPHDGGSINLGSKVSKEKLPDIVGKDLAQKIVYGEGAANPERDSNIGGPGNWKKLSGVDLKVGGEGMKGFYDKIVPEAANKLGKQFGAKVGSTEITTTNSGKPTDDGAGGIIREGGEPVKKSVPYFPITNSMRESVMSEGQPLFSRQSPVNGLPENIEELVRTNKFKDMPEEYKRLQLQSWRDIATGNVSDKVKSAAKQLRTEDDKNYEIGSANNILHDYIANHMTRMYKDENPAGRVVVSNAKQGKFATNVSMAKHQVYDSHLTALLKSPKEIVMDPAYVVAQGRAALIKAAANRQFIDNLRDNFTRASDGRPAVVLAGAGRVVSGPDGEDPKTFISPDRLRKLNIADNVVQQMKQNGDLARYLDDGTIKDITPKVHLDNLESTINRLEQRVQNLKDPGRAAQAHADLAELTQARQMVGDPKVQALKAFNDRQTPVYVFEPQDYIRLEHPSFKDWKFITGDSDGNPVFANTETHVHPEFSEYLKNRLGLEPSALQKSPISRAVLKVGSGAKKVLLDLSPFHLVQEALRGLMVGINPFSMETPDLLHGEKINPSDPFSPTKLHKITEQGGTFGTDYKAQQEHSEGVSSGGDLLRKVPLIGKPLADSMNFYQDFLFRRYIPSLKSRAAEKLFDQYRESHSDWSVDKVAKATALHINDTFGGQNWAALGRSATTQDFLRVMTLAPDWLESELRSGARLFNKDEGGIGRTQVLRMALGLWGIARVMNLITTGNAHYEAPFSLAVKNKDTGKETMFGIRTLPTDLLSAASDPVRFLRGRLSPAVRTGEELLSQRDQFGRKLGPEDLWVDVTRQLAPIPLQGIGQALSGAGPDIGSVGQTVKALGGTAQTYQTPAQKLAAELASNHNEDGPVDYPMMARHRTLLRIEDQVRQGQVGMPELYKMAYQDDSIKESELKKIINNYKQTRGMDPGTASLYARASRLPAQEYFTLFDQMNPSEKTALLPLTKQIMKRYVSKASKDMRPDERARDPLFRRILQMLPQVENQPQQTQ